MAVPLAGRAWQPRARLCVYDLNAVRIRHRHRHRRHVRVERDEIARTAQRPRTPSAVSRGGWPFVVCQVSPGARPWVGRRAITAYAPSV